MGVQKATGRQSWTDSELSDMFDQYVETALWSTTGDDDEPLDAVHSADDIPASVLDELRESVLDFYAGNRRDLVAWTSPQDAGHLFWLNRNGHGVGFWDRTYTGAENTAEYRARYGLSWSAARSRVRFNAAMERLSADAKVHGSVNLSVGDDGLIYT